MKKEAAEFLPALKEERLEKGAKNRKRE